MKTLMQPRTAIPIVALAAGISACGGKTPGSAAAFAAYEDNNVTVIGDASAGATGERIYVTDGQSAGECVTAGDNLCVPTDTAGSDWCKGQDQGGPIDIIIIDGTVVDVVCYPPPGNNDKPEEIIDAGNSGNVDVLQTSSGTAIIFDESTNGTPIVGDMNIAGNQVSIYGNGPDQTTIDGDVLISGNDVRLRGVTITGNLDISLNKAAIILCRVLGNVVLSTAATNNSVIVENDVFGSFTASSNSNIITGNDVDATWTLSGQNNNCDGNHAFDDANANQWVDDGETGDALTCP